jgi:DNA polymerase III delta subunit
MDARKPSPRSPRRSSAAPSKAGDAAGAEPLALLARAEAGEFPPTLAITGPDESLKAAFLAEYRAAWARAVPEAPHARVLWPGEDDVDTLLSAFHGVSMFTPRELFVVFGIEQLGRSEKRVAALAAGLARPAGGNAMVLVESAAEGERKTLQPLIAACAVRWEARLEPGQPLRPWAERWLAARGLTADAGALDLLAERCEDESTAYFNELGKLPYLARDGRVTREQVASLTDPMLGAELVDFLGAVARGEAGRAQQKLARMLAEGEGEGGVLFALGNLVGGALGGWSRHKELSLVLARRVGSPRRLARALDAVYRTESAWKGGRADIATALEQATREVATA